MNRAGRPALACDSGIEAIRPEGRYTASEVSILLFGAGPFWFARHRRLLNRRDGFPRPLSSVGHSRWLGADLLAWAYRDKAPDDGAAANVVDLSRALRARARAVAKGEGLHG